MNTINEIIKWSSPVIVTSVIMVVIEFCLTKIIKPKNRYWWTKENQIIIVWQNRVLSVGIIIQLAWMWFLIGKIM